MARRIQGITIELDGETRGLQKALQDVDKQSRSLQQELRDVERLLKFDPGNVEALAQKQQLLSKQVENTTERLNRLRSAQAQVEAQFQRGEIGEEQFRAFRREIQFTETQLKKFETQLASLDDGKSLDNVKKDLQGTSKAADDAQGAISELGGAIAGLATGIGIGEAVTTALESASLETSIEISMDVPPGSIAAVRTAVNTVTSYIDDQEAALEGVRRQWALNADASDEANARIVKGAAAISRAYAGLDFQEVIQETNEISKSLEISNDEALGLVNALLKMGFPPEQVDIISEYGTQLKMAGYDAKEIQAIFAAGLETGTWNIDNLLDGLKEGRIRLAEFGQEVPKAVKELLKGTGISAQELRKWGKAVAQGGDAGKKAMVQVAQALSNIDDETTRNTLGVQIFGTMWEDQGQNITNTILGAKNEVADLKENQEELNETVEELDEDPFVRLRQAVNELKTALAPLINTIASLVGSIADWIQNNPQLASTIFLIVGALGAFLGILAIVGPIVSGLVALVGALSVAFGVATGPIWLIIAAIAALIAIGVILYQNWDTIKAKAKEIWGAISAWLKQTWENLKQSASEKWEAMKNAVSEKMESARKKIKDIWNQVMNFFKNIDLFQTGKNIIQGLINGISSLRKSLFKKADEIAAGVKNRIKNSLKIGSPSKVMEGYGEDTVRGFVLGIQSALGGIQDVSDRLASTVTAPVQPTSGAPTATESNREYNVTINNYDGFDRTGQNTVAALRRWEWLDG